MHSPRGIFRIRRFRGFKSAPPLELVRYSLILLHVVLWTQMLVLSVVWTNMIASPLIAFIGVGLIVYVPAMVYLSAADSNSRYDHVAGEIAYLCVQTIWSFLLATISGLDYKSLNLCSRSGLFPSCPAVLAVSILALAHMFTLLAWMGVIIYAARRHPSAFAYQMPAHRIVRPLPWSGEVLKAEAAYFASSSDIASRMSETSLKLK